MLLLLWNVPLFGQENLMPSTAYVSVPSLVPIMSASRPSPQSTVFTFTMGEDLCAGTYFNQAVPVVSVFSMPEHRMQ